MRPICHESPELFNEDDEEELLEACPLCGEELEVFDYEAQRCPCGWHSGVYVELPNNSDNE